MNVVLLDGHLDLALNALYLNRDLRLSAHEIREQERDETAGGRAVLGRGAGTVGFPDLRKGGVAVAIATVLARVGRRDSGQLGSGTIEFATQDIAAAHARAQLAWYRELARQGLLRILIDGDQIAVHLAAWERDPVHTPLGVVLSMEGADPIVDPSEAATWRADGFRIVSLAHYGKSTYAHGTSTSGPLTAAGRALLPALEREGIILDVTHLSDESFWDAMGRWGGRVVATHSNCRALCPGERQFDDDQLHELINRDAVIGAVVNTWMLKPGFEPGASAVDGCTLSQVVDHIDHVCQLAGNARHAAIGSDLDGGYGLEECPEDFDTIADLQRIPELLAARGYSDADIALIAHGNWLRALSA